MKSGIALRCAERRLIAVFLARELAHNAHRKGRSGSGGHRDFTGLKLFQPLLVQKRYEKRRILSTQQKGCMHE